MKSARRGDYCCWTHLWCPKGRKVGIRTTLLYIAHKWGGAHAGRLNSLALNLPDLCFHSIPQALLL